MPSVCIYFEVHQPVRLNHFSVFDIGNALDPYSSYFDHKKNRAIFEKVASKCYLPTNKLLLDLINEHDGKFRVSFSLTGCFVEYCELFMPWLLESFQELFATGAVDFIEETYYHSLSGLYDDLDEFDRLIAGTDLTQEQFYDDLEQELARGEALGLKEEFELMPRMPQARRRKVSVYDLVKALDKALEVKQRRVLNSVPPFMELPARKFDVTAAISNLFHRILSLFSARPKLTFSELLPGNTKQDKVYTFIPLLHLSHQQKVELEQKEQFGEIDIRIVEGKNVQQ